MVRHDMTQTFYSFEYDKNITGIDRDNTLQFCVHVALARAPNSHLHYKHQTPNSHSLYFAREFTHSSLHGHLFRLNIRSGFGISWRATSKNTRATQGTPTPPVPSCRPLQRSNALHNPCWHHSILEFRFYLTCVGFALRCWREIAFFQHHRVMTRNFLSSCSHLRLNRANGLRVLQTVPRAIAISQVPPELDLDDDDEVATFESFRKR